MKDSLDEKDFDYKLKRVIKDIHADREKFKRSMRRWDIFFISYIAVVILIYVFMFLRS